MGIVAGGWSKQGHTLKAQASVESYSLTKDRWIELASLPSPRVYFSLQVTDVELRAIGGYYKESNAKVFPGLATLKRNKKGLDSVWKEDKNEVDPQRQRAGFMTAEIPWPWIN